MNGCQWCNPNGVVASHRHPCKLRGDLARVHVTLLSILYVAKRGQTATARRMLMEVER